jgi:hypothetical protein
MFRTPGTLGGVLISSWRVSVASKARSTSYWSFMVTQIHGATDEESNRAVIRTCQCGDEVFAPLLAGQHGDMISTTASALRTEIPP